MRALALLMFAGATIPMAFIEPIVGLLLWILFSYMNPHRIAWGFATNFNWVLIIALVTIFSTMSHADKRQPLRMTPAMVVMTLFLFWTGVCALQADVPSLAHYYWVRFFKILMMAYFTLILVRDARQLNWVLWTIVLSFGFWGLKGGVFTVLSGGGYHVLGPGASFFSDNNGFALVMCMTLPLMRYVQMREKRRWIRIALWFLMGFTAVSVVGTYSRGGFLALAVTMLMLVFKSRRRASLIVVVPLVALAIGAFMPQQWYARMYTIDKYHKDASAQGRLDSYRFAFNLAVADPIFGGGMGVWASNSMWNKYGPPGAAHRAIHSIFFETLGENGFVGLFIFVALLMTTWFSLARIRKKARAGPETGWMSDLASMMQVSLVAYVAAGALLPMPYFDLLYQMVAITAVLNVILEGPVALRQEPASLLGNLAAGSSKPAPRRRLRPIPAGANRRADGPAAVAASDNSQQTGSVQKLPWY